MVEVASFVVFDGTFDACGVLELREPGSVCFDSITQIFRSPVIADEHTVSVCRVVENAGSFHSIHNHRYVFVAGSDEYVDIRDIVANQVPLLSDSRFDGQDSEDVRNGVWHCALRRMSSACHTSHASRRLT
jgi:hypothetical protein